MRRALLAALLLPALACGGGPGKPAASAPATAPAPTPLPAGKSDLPLDPGRYVSPDGFVPRVTFTIADPGWRSVHRGADAFDVGLPDPARDAPLVAVVAGISTATSERHAADALLFAAGGRRAAKLNEHHGLGGYGASRVDVRGGHGTVFTSRDQGIALDAAAGQRMRFYVAEVAGVVVVVGAVFRDGPRWEADLARAETVLQTIRFG
jgi:hypothetical protein